jgi:hypothetical protein
LGFGKHWSCFNFLSSQEYVIEKCQCANLEKWGMWIQEGRTCPNAAEAERGLDQIEEEQATF